jgi:hypothetical protein
VSSEVVASPWTEPCSQQHRCYTSARNVSGMLPHVCCTSAADPAAVAHTFFQEAYHLQTFNDFLDKRGLRGVATAPYVYRQFSSKRCVQAFAG